MSIMKIENVKKVQKYRKQGLTFRDIAKLLNSPVKSVYRWNKYNVGTYPQDKACNVVSK